MDVASNCRRWRTVRVGYGDGAPSNQPIPYRLNGCAVPFFSTHSEEWLNLGGLRVADSHSEK